MLVRFRLACSFCGKSAAEVSKLVAGRRAYICDECIATASHIISCAGPEPREEFQSDTFKRRLRDRLAQLHRWWQGSRSQRTVLAR